MINVTKTFLPPFEEYTALLKKAWDKAWLTNNGMLVQELELQLKQYLGVEHLLFTNNGTVPLQMALKAFNITKEVITTPFSYVATTTVIMWENCQPVFVDIDPHTFCIDASKIEAAITENTQAILATHVYGYPCDVEAIADIAKRHNLKVIYDGAHAFGVTYKGRSLLSYGDVSTCSFHATKVFHTGEGGCIIANDPEIANTLMLYRQFGHVNDTYYCIGINGKSSEFHAAMGLSVLPYFERIVAARKIISEFYDANLNSQITRPHVGGNLGYNYAYYPVVFPSEAMLMKAIDELQKEEISGRRYFFPALNELPFVSPQACPIAEDISRRVYCLPLYYELSLQDASRITACLGEPVISHKSGLQLS